MIIKNSLWHIFPVFIAVVLWSQTPENQKSIIRSYDFITKDPVHIELPKKLREISGLALNENDRVFAHDDERGIIYEIDPQDGTFKKRFYFGHLVRKADFEGLEWDGKRFYLVTSQGEIIALKEGRDKESVDYEVFETGLSRKYNIEGICFDPETASLLLACKDYPGSDYDGFRAVYTVHIHEKRREPEPRFLIPRETINELLSTEDFKPSGMARHPLTGTFFIISAQDRSIIELSTKGEILGMSRLKKKWHRQPEGIAISSDYKILIADEGGKHGTLTMYSINR